MDARVCLWLALCVCVRTGAVSVKGYFCQDPDTGLLHGINTTWPSTSFCGNYTCKIRAKNHTMDHAESRNIINVTSPPPKEELIEFTPEKKDSSQSSKTAIKSNAFPKDADAFFNSQEGRKAKPIYHRNSGKPSASAAAGIHLPFSNGAEDRFLNGEEIKTISELLHTVKKSDLEAIIEIYNLAQDIYKEMDAAEVSNTINEPVNAVPEKESSKTVKGNEIENAKKDKTSYWYEPFAINDIHKISDLKPEGSEFVPTSANIYKTQYSQTHIPPTTPPTYFSGTVLNNQDFGRLAYYYPISSFQRLASYYHQQRQQHAPPPPLSNSCDPCYRNPYPTPSLTDERRAFNPPPKPTEPTMLLPYPFSNQLNNGTGYAYNNYNNYYKGNPWAYYDYYKNNPYHFFNIGHAKNAPNVNPSPSPVVQTEGLKPVDAKSGAIPEKPIDESKPWQTEPLPEELIKEIRANIAERAKLLKMPLKKRIKLERVAKVIKLDHLNRHTRKTRNVKKEEHKESIEEKADIEVFIERTTCDADTELGYFRVGNMSQPFPHCCPQKIEGR